MSRKKGFTLIELMIVLSVIAILAMVIIPNVGSVKTESKNQAVVSNAMLVRSFLENRGAKDILTYNAAFASGKSYSEAMGGTDGVLVKLKTAMTDYFSGSNAIENPFRNITSINFTQGNVTLNNPTSASIVLGYTSNADDTLPSDNEVAKAAMPKGREFLGDVVIMVYKAGYVVYGVDNTGEISMASVIKFPEVPPAVASGTGGGSGENPGGGNGENPNETNTQKLLGNIGDVVTYLRSIAVERIIKGAPNSHTWDVIQGPLYNDLYNQFTPGNASKHIVNPYYLNVDSIGNDNNWVDPNVMYSIISNPQPDYGNIESKYSSRPGTIVVYYTSNPVGYVVYGVDQAAQGTQIIGRTEINLSNLITNDMDQVLKNNVDSVCSILSANINEITNGNQGALSSAAFNKLGGLNIKNAYIPKWTGKNTFSSQSFQEGYALAVSGWNMEGSAYSDFKGTVIVNVLSNCTGYEVFGVGRDGTKLNYKRVVR